MKPVIIYTLPRAKSTATLYACKRANLYDEPFSWQKMFSDLGPIEYPVSVSTLLEVKKRVTEYDSWDSIFEKLNHEESATKVFGSNLREMPKARTWFKQSVDNDTHDVFVLLRSPKEIILSLVLALNFGFHKETETEDREIVVDDGLIYWMDTLFNDFLAYYPKNGKVIYFDSLPEEHFDYNKIHMEPQNSLTRRSHCVKNLDEIKQKIDIILKFHSAEWKEKTGTDIFF
jgi:hypothetical protein